MQEWQQHPSLHMNTSCIATESISSPFKKEMSCLAGRQFYFTKKTGVVNQPELRVEFEDNYPRRGIIIVISNTFYLDRGDCIECCSQTI